MPIDRRQFLHGALATVAAPLSGCAMSMEHGFWNPCRGPAPKEVREHELVEAAFDGLDTSKVWDCHVHLVGVGDSDSGTYVNPAMDSWAHPIQSLQKVFYMNAACSEVDQDLDVAYLQQLINLQNDLRGSRLMVMAFDYNHSDTGQQDANHSTFFTPDRYAWRVARSFPDQFEWICSIHPYREDAAEAVNWAAKHGARAVKWLPPSMGIDPASPRCDRFYEALAASGMPLLSHGGKERAVESKDAADLGNPLRLRRALEADCTVIVAHCASLGEHPDIDLASTAPPLVSAFDLFARLMDEPQWRGQLYGEISAVTQANRVGKPLLTLLKRQDWHDRLINGSDYPLPGVFPLFSLRTLISLDLLDRHKAPALAKIREHNPILFDFVLKRHLRLEGVGFPAQVFETRRVFDETVEPA